MDEDGVSVSLDLGGGRKDRGGERREFTGLWEETEDRRVKELDEGIQDSKKIIVEVNKLFLDTYREKDRKGLFARRFTLCYVDNHV